MTRLIKNRRTLALLLGLCALAAGVVALTIHTGALVHSELIAFNTLPDSTLEAQRILLLDVNRGSIQHIGIKDSLTDDERIRVGNDYNPVWSPDGRRMAFVHFQYEPEILESRFVCVMEASGANPRCFDGGVDPAWASSDGTLLAFASDRVVYVMNVDTGERMNPSGYEHDGVYVDEQSDPAWSEGSNLLAFEWVQGTTGEIYVVTPDGEDLLNLTNHPAHDHSPTWSPDGTVIGFVSRRDDDGQIYLTNPDGTNLRQLTHGTSGIDHFAWSPDGTQMVYDDQMGNIMLLNADGTNERWLTEGELPTWSSDGRRIAFVGPLGVSTHLYVVNSDGSGLTTLVSLPDARFDVFPPVWLPLTS